MTPYKKNVSFTQRYKHRASRQRLCVNFAPLREKFSKLVDGDGLALSRFEFFNAIFSEPFLSDELLLFVTFRESFFYLTQREIGFGHTPVEQSLKILRHPFYRGGVEQVQTVFPETV